MFAPQRERCGISDYTRLLSAALREQPEIASLEIVAAPEDATRAGTLDALRRYRAENRRFRALGAQMNQPEADLAHIQHNYFFFGGVAPHKNHAAAFLDALRRPAVITVHEIARPEPDASPVTRHALAFVNRANFLHPVIRRWIVHTGQDREHLEGLGLPVERIHVIPVGALPVEPLPDPAEAKRALGLEGKQIVTLFGFLSAKKGHRVALEALKRLPNDVLLLFAGDRHPDDRTDYVPNLQREIAAQGLSGRARITGYLPAEQIPLVLAATDVAVAPFLQTSGSASLARLFAGGRAVVASDIAPHREIATDEPASLALFRSGDPDDLAAKVLALLSDSAARAALQAAALAYAERHSYANMAQETLAVYRLALA